MIAALALVLIVAVVFFDWKVIGIDAGIQAVPPTPVQATAFVIVPENDPGYVVVITSTPEPANETEPNSEESCPGEPIRKPFSNGIAPGNNHCLTIYVPAETGADIGYFLGPWEMFPYPYEGAVFFLMPTDWGMTQITDWVTKSFPERENTGLTQLRT